MGFASNHPSQERAYFEDKIKTIEANFDERLRQAHQHGDEKTEELGLSKVRPVAARAPPLLLVCNSWWKR